MKQLNQIIATIAVTLGALTQTVHAGLITGNVAFIGQVNLNTSSAGTATAADSWANVIVEGTSGIFASGPHAISFGSPVTFTSQTWDFNTTAPITNFWNVGGFKFELSSSFILSQGGTPGTSGFSSLSGVGVVSGNGYTPTTCSWSLSISDPPASGTTWTFVATINSMNSDGAPVLASTTISNAMVFRWSDPTYALQSAPAINGTFANIPGATSPYTNSIAGTPQFFRLLQP